MAVERGGNTVLEERPVREPGELVVESLMEQLLFEVLAFTDVANVEDDAPHIRILLEVRAQGLGVDVPTVGAAQAELIRPRVLAAAGSRDERRDERLVVAVDERHEFATLERLRRVSE